jgi:hypothetical protein
VQLRRRRRQLQNKFWTQSYDLGVLCGSMIECRTTECWTTECRTTECRTTECRTTECRTTKCRMPE